MREEPARAAGAPVRGKAADKADSPARPRVVNSVFSTAQS